MGTVTGSGSLPDLFELFIRSGLFFDPATATSTGFTLTDGFGHNVTVTGTDLRYDPFTGRDPVTRLIDGTITGITIPAGFLDYTNIVFSNLNVSARDFTILLKYTDRFGLNNLFFGGNDTFTWSGTPSNSFIYGTGLLLGLDGDDTFNVSNWGGGYGIDGGNGYDTLNVTGGIGAIAGSRFSFPDNIPPFKVLNIEKVNLGAGYDYTIIGDTDLVSSGSILTIDASALGPANSFSFYAYSSPGNPSFSGNLVLIGGAGNDTFQGGLGSNIFIGGEGVDTVSFANSAVGNVGVNVDLSVSGFQVVNASGERVSLSGIENLFGSPGDDTLAGDGGDNILAGNGDFTTPGDGNDVLNGGAGYDTAIFRGALSDYTITHSGGTTTVSGPGGTATLTGVEQGQFSDQTVQISGPVVTTRDKRIAAGQTVALPSLFSVNDLNGAAIVGYQLWDATRDSSSGHFIVNGVAQAAGTIIIVSPAQLAQTSFVGGTVNDNLQIRAYDGTSWSAADGAAWGPFTAGPAINNAPVVTTANKSSSRNQALALSSLFTVTDADGDAITRYQLWDSGRDPSSGYFTINGVKQAAGTIIDITAAQLAQTAFVTSRVSDALQIRAYDGIAWSAADNASWGPFTVSVPADVAPSVVTNNSLATGGQVLSLSSLVTFLDGDGDPAAEYQLRISTLDPNAGHWVVNGVDQPTGMIIDITGAQAAQTSFVAGRVTTNIQVRASDGILWSADTNTATWAPLVVSAPLNHAPVVTTSNRSIVPGSTVALSTLFSVTDADSDAIPKYQLWDATRDPNSGHFVVNGVAQAAGTIIEITPAQLTQTSFVMGTVATNLQIRAFDGLDWSAGENASWSPFTVSPRVNHAPVLLSNNGSAPPGQSLTLSSLFSVSDADGDAITKYQLWDASRDPNSGHFAVNGVVQSAGTIIEITAAQLAQTTFVVGQLGDNLQIRAFDGAAWSAGDNDPWSPLIISPVVPILFPNGPSGTIGQSLAVSGFFNAVTPNGAITKYQLKDTTSDPASGYFTINGAQQSAGAVIEITAAQLAQTAFVVGHINDAVQIRAFDGTAWSAPDNGAWTAVTVSPPPNHAPSLTTSNKTAAFGTTLALSSLFSVSDADGDSITKYELWDANRDPSSGHFVINNVDQPAGTIIDVTAAQLAQTSFVVGAGADPLQIRAFDGKDWSAGDTAAWAPFTVSSPINHAPSVATVNRTMDRRTAQTLSNLLFSVTDPDGDAITKYQLWDATRDPNSGHFVVNGVPQPAGTVIEITAAQLASTTFVSGIVPDNLQVRAFDGQAWSAADNAAWSPFTVFPAANRPPLVFTIPRTGRKGDTFQLPALVATNDFDQDTITKYQLWDATRDPSSGYFTVNGVAQAAGAIIEVTAAQVSQTFFVLGSVNDNLQIRAFDGTDWSAADNAAWAPFTMTVRPNVLPVVTTANMNAPTNQSLALSSLFSVSDADGDSIPAYQLWDATRDANSGHFAVNGVDQAAGTIIQITADQLSQTSFVTGAVGDSLQIRAMDSRGDWSAGDTAAWSPFTISVRNNTAPVVTTVDKNTTAGQSLTLSSLLSVSDADGDTMTKYQLWDATRDATSGHFVINNVAQSAGTIIDVTAAQLSQTSFLTGTMGDSLQIRAFDGYAWSAGDTAAWAPFHINVS